ncbi:MAG: triose-phosphate isomerase, partial [Muribaculaceae bacterium]|nr:triose-phosphate isomerase [Muribaculaceae bacterium]
MRKNIVAGNWKMNTTLDEGVELADQVNNLLQGKEKNCDVVVCVPFTHLTSVNAVIDQDLIGLGAENCSEHEKGAYTGEVSAAMVKSTG